MSTMNQPRSNEDTKVLEPESKTARSKAEPELRFTEFAGDWVKQRLGEVSFFHDGKRVPLKDSDRAKRQGKYPYYGASGIIDYIDDFIFDGEYVLLGEDGANIVTRSTKLAFLVKGKFWVNNHAHIMEAKNSNTFLAESLERIRYEIYNTGTAQPKLNAEVCRKIPLYMPSPKEQQKIADFLSSVDKKIEQLTEKHRLLTEYKKGIMQQIFTQKIRFKDNQGNDYPEWTTERLGSISKRKTIKNKDESVKLVLTNSATQGIVSQTDYFDKDIANQNNLGGYYIVEQDDFVYNPRISVSAPVGPIKRNHLSTGVMSPLYSVFAITKGSKNFFERYFETNLWHRYMNQIANFGARHDRMNVTTADFYNMPMPFPCLEEQQKIANFLTETDQKIDQAWSTLEQTKAFKKGLLQKMFV